MENSNNLPTNINELQEQVRNLKDENQKLNASLLIREKEIDTFGEVSKIVETSGISIHSMVSKIIEILPDAFRYPEHISIKIIYDKQEYKSKNYSITNTIHHVPIKIKDEPIGMIEVYIDRKMMPDQGNLLIEAEKNLLRMVADRLAILTAKDADEKQLEKVLRDFEWTNWELNNINDQLSQEIEAKEQAQAALRKSQDLIKNFMDSATENMILLDEDLNIIDLNQNAIWMMPVETREEAIGRPISELITDLKSSGRYDLYMEVMKTGKPGFIESVANFGPNGKRYLDIKVFRITEGLGILSSDITDKKSAEQQIKKSEADLKAILNSSQLSFVLVDEDLSIRSVNNEALKWAKRLLGTELKTNTPIANYLDEEAYELFREIMALVRDGRQFAIDKDFEIDNKIHWINFNFTPVLSEDEKVLGMCISAQEITDRKNVETALRESESKLRMLVENLPAGAVYVEHGKVLCNAAIEKLTGYSRHELRTLDDWFGKLMDKDSAIVKHPRLGEGPGAIMEPITFPIIRKNGERRQVEFVGYSYKGIDIWLVVDVTEKVIAQQKQDELMKRLMTSKETIEQQYSELKSLHEKLAESEVQLKAMNASKDKFFSIIAHDLKNPLGSFKNVTEVLVKDYEVLEEEDRLDFIQLMNQNAKQLYNLLENLLQWSRSQSGSIQFHPMHVDVSMVASENVALLKMLAGKKRITLQSNVDNSCIAWADINMMTTIIRNLVTNAIKFTNEGGEINISCADAGDFVELSVTDNGIGMDEDTMAKLFRIDISHTSLGTANEQGTGLGLILCQEFVIKHGGRIWVESQAGKGSTFKFTIPKNGEEA